MLENQDSITIKELKAYLNSLEHEETKEKAEQINNCVKQGETEDKSKQKIEEKQENERRNQTKDKILSLLNECETIMNSIKALEIAEYMIYRVDIIKSEHIIEKARKKLKNRYNKITKEVLRKVQELKQIKSIDFSMYEDNTEELQNIKEQFKEEYTNEERKALVQKELDIIEKVKIFNITPIPHEILKTSDKEIQAKMNKFNKIRQKRLKILSTLSTDYLKLGEPREIDIMIDEALSDIENIEDILTKTEFNKIKRSLFRRRKKVFKSTSEIRSIIKSKEKRTGIVNYNLQEARYMRMEHLRKVIIDATNIIKLHEYAKEDEKLKKLQMSYEKEKQYTSVIEKLGESIYTNDNLELKLIEEQITNIKNRIENSKKIILEQEEKIAKARQELIVLWKIEIDNTVSRKKEVLALTEPKENADTLQNSKNIFAGLKKIKENYFKINTNAS